MREIIGALIAVFGFIGIVGSTIATRLWAATVVVLSILKLTGLLIIPWFAGAFTVSAIGTGLWLLLGGLLGIFVSFVVTAIGALIVESK